jgi:hypothetical protein
MKGTASARRDGCCASVAHSFFLPPIIFYAGLSVKKKHFFRNFFTIAGYGIVGTYVCCGLISLGLYVFLRKFLTFGVSGACHAQGWLCTAIHAQISQDACRLS